MPVAVVVLSPAIGNDVAGTTVAPGNNEKVKTHVFAPVPAPGTVPQVEAD